MSDSLLLADTIELVPGADRDTGEPGWFLTSEDFDLSAGVPDVQTIVRQFLDNDRVLGSRYGNRAPSLNIVVVGSDRLDLAARVDVVRQICASTDWPLTWTPDGGLPLVIECLGPSAPERRRIDGAEQQYITGLHLTVPANAHGRSRDLQFIDVNAGSLDQVQLDALDSGSMTGFTFDTARKWEGTASAKGVLTKSTAGPSGHVTDQYAIGAFGRALPGGAVDLTGHTSFGVRFRWPAPAGGTWTGQFLLELLSGGVVVAGGVRTIRVRAGDGRWRRLTFPIRETADVSAVDEWRVVGIAAHLKTKAGRPATSDFWVDDVRAYPPGSALNTTTQGAMLTVPGVLGSAKTPVNLEITDDEPFSGLLVHSPPPGQDPDLRVLMALGSSADETVNVAAERAAYFGTYAPVLLASSLGTGDRTVTITAEQTVDGVVVGSTVIGPYDYDSAAFDGQFLPVRHLTLPPVRVPDDNSTSSMTFRVESTSSGSVSVWTDLLLLDTSGQTVIVGDLPADTVAFYLDEPDPTTGESVPYASTSDRSAARCVMDDTDMTGGPISLDPLGENNLLVVCPEGVPDIGVPYYPRWLDERTA